MNSVPDTWLLENMNLFFLDENMATGIYFVSAISSNGYYNVHKSILLK